MRYLDAARGLPVDRPPVWLMRQAGRYLPEYREVRARIGFQDAIRDPVVAAELTLQPMARFGLDAAIVFADIMTPLEGMGVKMTFAPGPVLDAPVRDAASLRPLEPTLDVPFVLETLGIVRRELADDVAVIGFAGAPFTLAAYLVEGGGSRDFLAVRALASGDPTTFTTLLDTLATSTVAYLRAQANAGADAVQLFDTWAGLLSRRTFRRLVLPVLTRLVSELVPAGVPVTYFAPGGSHLLDLVGGLDVDVIGVDWRVSLDRVRASVGAGRTLQGNVDPAALLAGPEAARAATLAVLDQGDTGAGNHIVNVGHGLTPATPVESVAALCDTVAAWRGNHGRS